MGKSVSEHEEQRESQEPKVSAGTSSTQQCGDIVRLMNPEQQKDLSMMGAFELDP